jgi:ABC-type phosphate/phosphonate transport system ATPase subunit
MKGRKMIQELEMINEMEQDNKWLESHQEDVRKKYENKFIAIKNQSIIASNTTLDGIIKELEGKGEKTSLVLIEFVHKKDFRIIL